MDYKIKKTDGKTEWFIKDRFGMFIHFGLYSLLARHEWIRTTEKIADDKYDGYLEYFNPDMFDAKEWAKKAKKAGMKYAVLTAKHHEGFCMFNSKYTDYSVINTPFGRDVVGEYVKAFRDEGLKVGIYYSLIDWHHSDFPIDVIHPHRDDGKLLDKGRDIKKYNEYVRNQVSELLTNYGKIDILWFDFSYPNPSPEFVKKMFSFDKEHPTPDVYPKDWMQYNGGKGKDEYESERLIKMIREINPEIILNDRADIPQDIFTPEQCLPEYWMKDKDTGEYLTWEACHTFSGSWGYYRDEMTWKSPRMLLSLLIKSVSTGGNLIMNVGPTGRGCFDFRADNALEVFEKWMKYNGKAIYGCTMADECFVAPKNTILTQSNDGKRLYLHLIDYPFGNLSMPSLSGKIKYAQFLQDASEIIFSDKDENCVFNLPTVLNVQEIPVIEVFLK